MGTLCLLNDLGIADTIIVVSYNTYHTRKWRTCIPSLSSSKRFPLRKLQLLFWFGMNWILHEHFRHLHSSRNQATRCRKEFALSRSEGGQEWCDTPMNSAWVLNSRLVTITRVWWETSLGEESANPHWLGTKKTNNIKHVFSSILNKTLRWLLKGQVNVKLIWILTLQNVYIQVWNSKSLILTKIINMGTLNAFQSFHGKQKYVGIHRFKL